jgi:ubiquinol-cytochrome c reductase iron-sulfur subunit
VDQLGNHNDLLADPNSDDSLQPGYIKDAGPARARNPEYWVGLAVCTHLGCSPLGAFEPANAYQVAGTDLGPNWPGGFYCPCHGSKYDISGRVFKSMPAPKNLTVPSYTFAGDARIVIGTDENPKTA